MRKCMILLLSIVYSFQCVCQDTCYIPELFISEQKDIDNFREQYPDCKVLTGTLYLDVNEKNLKFTGLDQIESIEGNLESWSGYKIFGLNRLKFVSDDVFLFAGRGQQIVGLDSLSKVGGQLMVRAMLDLEDLSGLSQIDTVLGPLSIIENLSMHSVKGLERLRYSNGLILVDNIDLDDISAFHPDYRIDSVLEITGNSLSQCTIKPICDFMKDTRGLFTIRRNKTGCEHEQIVRQQCLTSIPELDPSSPIAWIDYQTSTLRFAEDQIGNPMSLAIYGISGELISYDSNQIPSSLSYPLEELNPGIYILQIRIGTGQQLFLKAVIT